MARAIFGYEVVDGEFKINKEEARHIKAIYRNYLLGYSLQNAAKHEGLNFQHGTVGRILSEKRYLGTDVYPKILDEELFEQAQLERDKRKKALGRNYPVKELTPVIYTKFKWKGKKVKDVEKLYEKIEVIRND